jgi:cell division protease FtsH
MNQVQGGGSKVMSFGKSRAKRMAPDSPKIGLRTSLAGRGRRGLQEIKEFLENPKSSGARRAHPERLLYGPGTVRRCSHARSPAGGRAVLLHLRL